MKISMNSWHYRLINFLDFNHPDNLCVYFWKAMLSVVVIIAAPIMALAGVVASALMFFYMPILTLMWYLGFYGPGFDSGLFAISWIFVALISVGFTMVVTDEMNIPSIKIPTESLVYKYVDAKHRKVCPLLDFE